MIWKQLIAALWWQTHSIKAKDYLILSKLSIREQNEKSILLQPINTSLRKYLLQRKDFLALAEEDLKIAFRNNVSITCFLDEDYPSNFYSLDEPPLILSYWGKKNWQRKNLFSVVGSRKASRSTWIWMDTYFRKTLQDISAVCVSGAARGIDQWAHEQCLLEKTPSIAILPSGLNSVYPKNFINYIPEILEQGGSILSEYSLNQEIRKHHFLQRNRLIVSLSPCLFVPEAGLKSGSMMSAKLALWYGKEVACLPGSVLDSSFRGGNALLQSGADLILESEDLKDFILSANRRSLIPNFSKSVNSKTSENS